MSTSELPVTSGAGYEPMADAALAGDSGSSVGLEKAVSDMRLRATMQALRAKEHAWEWVFGGFAIAIVYILAVVAPRGRLYALDVVVMLVVAGGGLRMFAFETARSESFRTLVKDLDSASRPS